jgi:hypothetical protein
MTENSNDFFPPGSGDVEGRASRVDVLSLRVAAA